MSKCTVLDSVSVFYFRAFIVIEYIRKNIIIRMQEFEKLKLTKLQFLGF